jgi:hypothetical protein
MYVFISSESVSSHEMGLFVRPSFDHDCTLRSSRIDDVSVIGPKGTSGLEGEDGGLFCEGDCFVRNRGGAK